MARRDPFGSDDYLGLDFDTSYEDSEAWSGALKTDEAPERLAAETPGNRYRLRVFYFLAAGVFLLLLGRLLILQILNWDQNKALAEGNRIRQTEVRAPRGVIYDAKHQLVARNVPNVEVAVTPVELPRKAEDRTAVYQTLSDVLKKPVPEIQQTAEAKGLRYGQQVVIADKLDRDTSMLARVRSVGLAGVRVSENPQRQYERTDEFSHLIGYTGRVSEEDLKVDQGLQGTDYVGKTGLERVYESELRGTPGQQRVEVDANGEAIKELAATEPQRGQNLILGIDPDLQATMYKAVDNGIKSSRRQATGGSAIALNPKTGEVLGMVSAPGFDNNLFVNGIAQDKYQQLSTDERKPLFNRPVSGEYPPGSTFKLITAAGALAEGVVTPTTSVASPAFIEVGGSKFVDWKEDGHGSVTPARALAVSSDVFFYNVSGGYKNQRGIGEEKLADYMRQFGLGKQTGIDLPEERTGLVPTPKYKEDTFGEQWFIGNTYQMGIGQGFVLTTPLQVAQYTAAVANGGVAYKPHVVKAFENPDNPQEVRPVTPEQAINLKVDKGVIQTVQEGMRQAVATGTARELATVPVEICGKTGSAEFANETNSHAWFTAYAPCDDPQIVLTVMIEGGGEGSDVAVPAAKTILSQFFKVQAPPAKPSAEKSD